MQARLGSAPPTRSGDLPLAWDGGSLQQALFTLQALPELARDRELRSASVGGGFGLQPHGTRLGSLPLPGSYAVDWPHSMNLQLQPTEDRTSGGVSHSEGGVAALQDALHLLHSHAYALSMAGPATPSPPSRAPQPSSESVSRDGSANGSMGGAAQLACQQAVAELALAALQAPALPAMAATQSGAGAFAAGLSDPLGVQAMLLQLMSYQGGDSQRG